MATEEEQTAEEDKAQEAEEAAAEQEEEAEEKADEEDEQRDPGSTMISSWGYNREEELLEVTFQNGSEDSYPCSPVEWEDAASTASAGKWMWANVL